jgi:uncharacterized membrane protein
MKQSNDQRFLSRLVILIVGLGVFIFSIGLLIQALVEGSISSLGSLVAYIGWGMLSIMIVAAVILTFFIIPIGIIGWHRKVRMDKPTSAKKQGSL